MASFSSPSDILYYYLDTGVFSNHGLTVRTKNCTLMRCGCCIVRTSNIWIGSSKRSSEESFASVGRPASPTTRSYLGCLSSASRLPSPNINFAGWVMYPECVLLDSLVSSFLESLPVARSYVGVLK